MVSHKLQNNRKSVTESRRWFSKTLIAAYVVLGIVTWQTIHVASGGDLLFKRSAKSQIGSTKLHVDREATSRKNRATKEPVAAFFERAKRGMTEQEIRGMIADYEAIGSMPTFGDFQAAHDYGEKLNEWYVKAVADALSLTSEQKQTVRAAMVEKLERKIEEYKAILSVSPGAGNEAIVVMLSTDYLSTIRSQTNMSLWNLCELTEDQVKLTYKQFLKMRDEKSDINISPLSLEKPFPIYRSIAMHDAGTVEYIGYPPPSTMEGRCSIYGSVSGGIINVTNTFPLTPDQKLENHRNDLLTQAKLLHPAQLRLALLMNPGVAETIKYQLDKPWGQ